MKKTKLLVAAVAALCIAAASLAGCAPKKEAKTEMENPIWNVAELCSTVPEVEEIEAESNLAYPGNMKAVLMNGLLYQGKQTRIFAWVGVPSSPMPEGGYPAMVLAHGGLGRAYPDWVKMWTDRGYVAIAPDLDAQMYNELGKVVANPYGGPKGYGATNEMLEGPKEDTWTYQSVANLILAHSYLQSMSNVNGSKVGLTGISWGSYLSAIVGGLDKRFAFGAYVYGSGFLYEAPSRGALIGGLSESSLEQWKTLWDPAVYLPYTTMPTLWVAGIEDDFFSPVLRKKSYDLIQFADFSLCIKKDMTHGQLQGSDVPEIFAFANDNTRGGNNLLRITKTGKNKGSVWCEHEQNKTIASVQLVYTSDIPELLLTSVWDTQEVPFDAKSGKIEVSVPEGAAYCFFEITDTDGNIKSSDLIML